MLIYHNFIFHFVLFSSALAEYRTTKDAELELIKSKSLRIDRHQLNVRLAKECHRFGKSHIKICASV